MYDPYVVKKSTLIYLYDIKLLLAIVVVHIEVVHKYKVLEVHSVNLVHRPALFFAALCLLCLSVCVP